MNLEKLLTDRHVPLISLEMADKVQLMRRSDTKFLLNINLLPSILNEVADRYAALSIEGHSVLPYHTDYFDTESLSMYLAHHNQRSIRYKIRIRTYQISQQKYIEVKVKNNKGITTKPRVMIEHEEATQELFHQFVLNHTPYNPLDLTHTLSSDFHRITLVSNDYSERATIDTALTLSIPNGERKAINNLCIIEIKQEAKPKPSPITDRLNAMGIKPTAFSKYAIGMALLHPQAKHNRFKQIIQILNQMSHA